MEKNWGGNVKCFELPEMVTTLIRKCFLKIWLSKHVRQKKILVLMGGRAKCCMWGDTGVRSPIGARRICSKIVIYKPNSNTVFYFQSTILSLRYSLRSEVKYSANHLVRLNLEMHCVQEFLCCVYF